jgi:ribonuclease J
VSQPNAQSRVRLFPLGGLGEVGMNCLAIEQRGEVMLVDCGVTFDGRKIGIDVVHPDFSALEAYRDRIAGVFVTHGHEDHIGALPYLLKRFDVPVWGPPYALGLVRERVVEHEVLRHVRFIETQPRSKYEVGSFIVEPIRVTHSIADATALAIETDAGTIVHTGDFKFDETPVDGEAFDVERLGEIANDGVALLLSDSTNIDASGPTGSEAAVGEVLEEIVLGAKQAVVVAMFASNVHRLQLLARIAGKTQRRIVPLGRSIHTHSRVARATGYLEWDAHVFPAERVRELPRDRILAIATGTQAEANGALNRLARGDHPAMQLVAGDTVILSSRIIPGNEREVFGVLGDLLRRGVELRTWMSDRGVHVSGHAHRQEQRRMIELVKPRAFVPVHGTLHHLLRHGALARELGVPSVCVVENGDVIELDASGATKAGRVATGRTHVFAARELPASVLRERMALASEGVALAVVPVDAGGAIAGEIALATRGVMDESVDVTLLADVRHEVRAAIAALAPSMRGDAAIGEAARLAVRRALGRTLGFKPTTIVSVQRKPSVTS